MWFTRQSTKGVRLTMSTRTAPVDDPLTPEQALLADHIDNDVYASLYAKRKVGHRGQGCRHSRERVKGPLQSGGTGRYESERRTVLSGLLRSAAFPLARDGWVVILRDILHIKFVELGLEESLVGQLCLVFSNQSRGECAAQRVLHHLIVLTGAKQDTDRRTLVLFTHVPVQSLKVEVQLAKILRSEFVDLKFKGHQAIESTMKEEKVQCKVARAYLYRKLGTDKAEIPAKLQQELFHAVEQCTVKLILAMLLWQPEKLDDVGISENISCLWVCFGNSRRNLSRGKHGSLKERHVELPLQLAARPPFLYCNPKVKFAFLGSLASRQDDEMVGPRQLSQQCRDNCFLPVRLIELLHSEQVWP